MLILAAFGTLILVLLIVLIVYCCKKGNEDSPEEGGFLDCLLDCCWRLGECCSGDNIPPKAHSRTREESESIPLRDSGDLRTAWNQIVREARAGRISEVLEPDRIEPRPSPILLRGTNRRQPRRSALRTRARMERTGMMSDVNI